MTDAHDRERSVWWEDDAIAVIDQTLFPRECSTLRLRSIDQVVDAIQRLAVRGAPAIGVVGALGVALSAQLNTVAGCTDARAVHRDGERIARSRPTAVTLAWGVNRALGRLGDGPQAVLLEALDTLTEVEDSNLHAARRAAEVIRGSCPHSELRIVTHCNTGRFATVAWGTALGAIRVLAQEGLVREVLACETRPLLQGARLTTWELADLGIPYRLCVDAAGPMAIGSGMADCVLVGADRIAANGDVANKIGTYALAVAAARQQVPFVVVAPEPTIDVSVPDGSGIPIEERDPREVLEFGGSKVAACGTAVFSPAFDVTPAELITAIATDRRVIWPARQQADTDSARVVGT